MPPMAPLPYILFQLLSLFSQGLLVGSGFWLAKHFVDKLK